MSTDLTTLPSQYKLLLPDALKQAVAIKTPIMATDTKLRKSFAEAHDKMNRLEAGMKFVLNREFAKDVARTQPGVIRPSAAGYDETLAAMKADIDRRCDEFSEGLYTSGFGRIEWTTPSKCRFDYPELHIRKGFLENKLTTTRHLHELEDARQHKLPALDVKRPAIVDRIIQTIPADLHKNLKIVTGLEVVKGSHVESEEMRLTGLGQVVYGTRDAIVDGAQRVGTGIANGAAAVGRALTSDEAKAAARMAGNVIGGTALVAGGAVVVAGAAALAVAALPFMLVGAVIADPCLVLGDVVLVGWEN